MKRIVNNPDNVLKEMLEGFMSAYGDNFIYLPEYQAIRKRTLPDRPLIFGGAGGGCEPWCMGYLGENLSDVCCAGNVFTAPSAYNIYMMGKECSNGKGILFVYGNFSGDFLNHDMAKELLELEGIACEHVILRDDIASAPNASKEERGGIAGMYFLMRCLSAAAHTYSLPALAKFGSELCENIFTLAVVLESGSSPYTGEKLFAVAYDRVDFGRGFNGEPGILSIPMANADTLTDTTLELLAEDMSLNNGDNVAVLINNMGALTSIEQYIISRRTRQWLENKGVLIHSLELATVQTSQEMRGFSITLMRLDNTSKGFLDTTKVNSLVGVR